MDIVEKKTFSSSVSSLTVLFSNFQHELRWRKRKLKTRKCMAKNSDKKSEQLKVARKRSQVKEIKVQQDTVCVCYYKQFFHHYFNFCFLYINF